MSELTMIPPSAASEATRRGSLPEAPLPMPEQQLETRRRSWFAGWFGLRQQPGRI